jgi:hypothetical protein
VDALSGDTGAVEEYLRSLDFVADVYGPSDLGSASNTSDEYLRLYRHSWRRDRVPRLPLMSLRTYESSIGRDGLMVRLTEGTMPDIDAATHGSPYDYDRRVPLIFMGSNVSSGVDERDARTVDVAPTAAALAGLTFPEDVDGTVLFE